MKKILLCSAALVGVAFAAPAMAQVDVTVGGVSKNYMGWADSEGLGTKSTDLLTESEVHFNAEGTADNGLTYGFHAEAEADKGNGFEIDESYLYLSSNLGRVNIGAEDGANYLLQVAAPSADSNIDGIRQEVNPFTFANTTLNTAASSDGLDYDNNLSAKSEKITYLSPNYNGFQAGVSYTPSVGNGDQLDAMSGFASDTTGLGDAYDVAGRYEGTFNNVGYAVGAGYTYVNNDTAGAEDIDEWNVGVDTNIGAFGLGAIYTVQNNVNGVDNVDMDTIVVGGDYTTGPFVFGASYMNKDTDNFGDADRYAGGVVYSLTQGLSLRGSVQYVDASLDNAADEDATAVLGGIQFNF